MELLIKKLQPDAVVPTFAHADDAGMDLCAVADVTLAPGARVQVATGIALAIPVGYVGLIWDKSGLSHKAGIKTLGGVIDAGYRGEILVGVLNTSGTTYTFTKGQKVAQLLVQKVEHPALVVVEELADSARGTGAFGSTGV